MSSENKHSFTTLACLSIWIYRLFSLYFRTDSYLSACRNRPKYVSNKESTKLQSTIFASKTMLLKTLEIKTGTDCHSQCCSHTSTVYRCHCSHIHYTIEVCVAFSHIRGMQNRVQAPTAIEEAVSCRRARGKPRAEKVPFYSVHHVHCLWVSAQVFTGWTL